MTLTILVYLFVAGGLLSFILNPFRIRNPRWKESKLFVLTSLVLGLALGFVLMGALNLVRSSFWILGLTVFALEYTFFDLAEERKNRRLNQNKKRMIIDLGWRSQEELAGPKIINESGLDSQADESNSQSDKITEPLREELPKENNNRDREFLTEKKIKECSLTHDSPPFLIKKESFGEKGPGL